MNGEQAGPGLGYREASEKGSLSMKEKTPVVGGEASCYLHGGAGLPGLRLIAATWWQQRSGFQTLRGLEGAP